MHSSMHTIAPFGRHEDARVVACDSGKYHWELQSDKDVSQAELITNGHVYGYGLM